MSQDAVAFRDTRPNMTRTPSLRGNNVAGVPWGHPLTVTGHRGSIWNTPSCTPDVSHRWLPPISLPGARSCARQGDLERIDVSGFAKPCLVPYVELP